MTGRGPRLRTGAVSTFWFQSQAAHLVVVLPSPARNRGSAPSHLLLVVLPRHLSVGIQGVVPPDVLKLEHQQYGWRIYHHPEGGKEKL